MSGGQAGTETTDGGDGSGGKARGGSNAGGSSGAAGDSGGGGTESENGGAESGSGGAESGSGGGGGSGARGGSAGAAGAGCAQCGATQYCVLPCCGGVPICTPAAPGGVCPAGSRAGCTFNCTFEHGCCEQICMPGPPACSDTLPIGCFQSSPDSRVCQLMCP